MDARTEEALDRLEEMVRDNDRANDRRMDAISDDLEALQEQPVVKFKRLRPNAVIPKYQTPGAAGMDLHACFEEGVDGVHLMDDMVLAIPTGLAIEVPPGYEAQIRPRSGLAAKSHVTVLNTPGTVDSDYRGEVKVILINYGPKDLPIKNGDRIAQLVIAPVAHARVSVVEELSDTKRGAGGFGSTGT